MAVARFGDNSAVLLSSAFAKKTINNSDEKEKARRFHKSKSQAAHEVSCDML